MAEMKRLPSLWHFKKEEVDGEYIKLKKKKGKSLREETIIKVYEGYIKDKDYNLYKYPAYQLIQGLLKMTDEEFSEEFRVSDEKGVEKLVKYIRRNVIQTSDELSLKAVVAKYVEYSWIYLKFSNSFRLEDISDKVIV